MLSCEQKVFSAFLFSHYTYKLFVVGDSQVHLTSFFGLEILFVVKFVKLENSITINIESVNFKISRRF